MNYTNLHFQSTEEQDDFLQNLSVKELKNLSKQSKYLFKNEGVEVGNESLGNELMDDSLMNMSLSQLRHLRKNAATSKEDKHLIAVKSKTTGLSKAVIQQIESNKGLASLNDIMTYCQKLNISYKEFLPELFESGY
ncbi:MAG: helix-turn-helix transcriptional regulator [Chitinophagales bacterium]